ncbi:MAG: hypothetical protein GY757_29210, partial [bacterium]|nr:hypothetical protein [bacterium]
MNQGKKNTGCVRLFLSLILVFSITNQYAQENNTQEKKEDEVVVRGAALTIDPARQTVPVNTGTAVKTEFSIDNPEVMEGMIIKGQL